MSNNGRGYFPLPWKNNEHRFLPYTQEPFNNPEDLARWKEQGYTGPFTGSMYDMRNSWQPWIDISLWEKVLGWKQMTWSFYKMTTGTILPEHVDTFKRYKELYPLLDHNAIYRAIVFLEDWQPGHVLTLGNEQVEQWSAGSYVWWKHDVPHLAANVGTADRYTLQLTGFNIED